MISLSYLSIEAWAIEKKKREKMACPRSMTQKKMDTSMSMKKREKKDIYIYIYIYIDIYIYIAMSSCYPNKGERDS